MEARDGRKKEDGEDCPTNDQDGIAGIDDQRRELRRGVQSGRHRQQGVGKELVALANLAGGRVLLGVEDDGSVSGITRSDLEEWVMTACRDKIRPEIIPYFEIIRDVEPGKDVAVIQVERGWAVHCVWHNQHRTYYIRVGSQSREASPEELERLFQQRGAFRLELRPVSGSSLVDLDRRRLRDYFVRIRKQEVPEDGDVEGWQTLLVNTEIMVDENDRVPVTVAGLSAVRRHSPSIPSADGHRRDGIPRSRKGLCRQGTHCPCAVR